MDNQVQWSVTVSAETNDAVMKFLAERGEGIEGLSNLVSKAVGQYIEDPDYKDRASSITEGELNDLIAAEVDRVKEKYSGITMGQFNDMVAEEARKIVEKK